MFPAIILAAGASSRMGRPKALLPHRDPAVTFVAYAIRAMRAAGVVKTFVVGRPTDSSLCTEVQREGAVFIVNPTPELGQLSSLLAGLEVAAAEDADAEGVIVLPVDVSLVSPAGISALLQAATTTDRLIIRPASFGRHGHPVIFRREVFEELRHADPSMGAKAVVRADASRVLDVDVGEEPSMDIDTPDDYFRAFGRRLRPDPQR